MINSKKLHGITRYFDTEFGFGEVFRAKDGLYMRSESFLTGEDPFMRSFPNLLDIGIMGSCEHGTSGLCVRAGVQCYQDGLGVHQPDMSYLDYQEIIRQVRGKVMQVALGGRGDPNKHQQFGDILKLTRANDIVPNYTTSGLKLTQDEVSLTVEYCGAVAVSWYRSKYTLKALDAFISAGATTNIHYVLSNSSIDEAIDRLKKNNFFGDGTNRINAVVFLIHKPVGLGDQSEVLRAEDPRVHEFFDIVSNWQGNFSIGVDSCSTPGIVNFASSVRMDYLDTCEGARFSAYITPDMIMTPCSFDQSAEYGVSLRDHTIEEAWASDKFKRFRDHLRTSCPSCQNRNECMGGCPLKPEIVLCKKEDRSEN